MVKASLAGREVSLRDVFFRELGFGGATDVEMNPCDFELSKVEFLNNLRTPYDRFVEDQKARDQADPTELPDCLRKLGYPSLEELMVHPAEFSEIFGTWLSQELLQAIMKPETAQSAKWVVNSIDSVHTTPTGEVAVACKAFRRQGR